MSLITFVPGDRLVDRAMANLFHDLDHFHRDFTPYWAGKRLAADFAKDEVNVGEDKFEVAVDVSSFHPNELEVAVEEGHVVVRGTHEQKTKHSSVRRHFERRYALPEAFDEAQLRSSLAADGKLHIAAPKKENALPAARTIPIEFGHKQ